MAQIILCDFFVVHNPLENSVEYVRSVRKDNRLVQIELFPCLTANGDFLILLPFLRFAFRAIKKSPSKRASSSSQGRSPKNNKIKNVRLYAPNSSVFKRLSTFLTSASVKALRLFRLAFLNGIKAIGLCVTSPLTMEYLKTELRIILQSS